jgi:hypothetical protein
VKLARRCGVLAANAAWLLASAPAALAFLVALRFPQAAQRRLLRRTLRANRDTRIGRACGFGSIDSLKDFARVPAAGYDACRDAIEDIRRGDEQVLTAEAVKLLQPTSGTSAAPKLIPFTRGLQRQFQAALAPWIGSLYVLRPRLLFGRQYWCLSPNTRPVGAADGGVVPIGFADDTEYLGRSGRWFARQLLVAPPALARVSDPQAFEFLTLLFLVAADDLRLISVWHPSFLTVLIDALPRHAAALAACLRNGRIPGELALPPDVRADLQLALRPRPDRANAVFLAVRDDALAPAMLWPRLQVVSCWGGASCTRWIEHLRVWFPGVAIQPKGLLATEGVVTIPWGLSGRQVCAVRSHVLEFLDADRPDAVPIACAAMETHHEYSVVLTTAGGLYRYRLGDHIRVTGRVARTPCLEFVRREGLVSDICGEKLTEGDAEAALAAIAGAAKAPIIFGMLVPDRDSEPPAYVVLIETRAEDETDSWPALAEAALAANFHYRHARRLSQLARVRIHRLPADAVALARAWLVARGARHGDIKFPALRTEDGWPAAFPESSRQTASCRSSP